MSPKFCRNGCGPTLYVLADNIFNDMVTHSCVCSKCGESIAISQTVEQWKKT